DFPQGAACRFPLLARTVLLLGRPALTKQMSSIIAIRLAARWNDQDGGEARESRRLRKQRGESIMRVALANQYYLNGRRNETSHQFCGWGDLLGWVDCRHPGYHSSFDWV